MTDDFARELIAKMWQVIDSRDGEFHIVPTLDTREHLAEIDCWCCPLRDTDDKTLIIHNSADKRELHETH